MYRAFLHRMGLVIASLIIGILFSVLLAGGLSAPRTFAQSSVPSRNVAKADRPVTQTIRFPGRFLLRYGQRSTCVVVVQCQHSHSRHTASLHDSGFSL